MLWTVFQILQCRIHIQLRNFWDKFLCKSGKVDLSLRSLKIRLERWHLFIILLKLFLGNGFKGFLFDLPKFRLPHASGVPGCHLSLHLSEDLLRWWWIFIFSFFQARNSLGGRLDGHLDILTLELGNGVAEHLINFIILDFSNIFSEHILFSMIVVWVN